MHRLTVPRETWCRVISRPHLRAWSTHSIRSCRFLAKLLTISHLRRMMSHGTSQNARFDVLGREEVRRFFERLAPQAGFEPATLRLTATFFKPAWDYSGQRGPFLLG